MRRLVLALLARLRLQQQSKLSYVVRVPFGALGSRVTWSDFLEIKVFSDRRYTVREPKHVKSTVMAEVYRLTMKMVHRLGRAGQLHSISNYIPNSVIVHLA